VSRAREIASAVHAVLARDGWEPDGPTRRAIDELADKAERDLSWAREQHTYLYDQWGLRIVHCSNREPHNWHGWTHYKDLRCPGIPDRESAE
jgi:hypothetical protein